MLHKQSNCCNCGEVIKMVEKKGKFEFDDKLKEGAKKAGQDIKEGGAEIKKDISGLGSKIKKKL